MIIDTIILGVEQLRDTLKTKSEEFKDVVKIGRTHLDATPLVIHKDIMN
jgi:fumarate hydratase class II